MPEQFTSKEWITPINVVDLSTFMESSSLQSFANPLEGLDLWCIQIENTHLDPFNHYSSLSNPEQQRASAFKNKSAAKQYVFSHVALRKILAENFGPESTQFIWKETEHKKPILETPNGKRPIEFNISHCTKYIAIALSSKPVGVDIEGHREMNDLSGVSDIVYTDIEKAFVLNNSQQTTNNFFQLWTSKEALLKADGSGFMRDPKKLEITPATNAPDVYWNTSIPGHHLAWAVMN